jgi:transcription termination/antitermination protein NusG
MDLPEPQEQFEQEPMDEIAEEQNAPAEMSHAVSASDAELGPGPETQIPEDLPPVEAIVDEIPEESDAPAEMEEAVSSSDAQPGPGAETQIAEDLPPVEAIVDEIPEEPDAPAEMEKAVSSSDAKRAARPQTQLPKDLPPVEAIVEGPAWYVIHCYSGYENKVRHNLEQRIETMGMKDRIFDVVIPTQEEIEVKDGKRRTVERHIFPGYVLVNLALSEESWYVVRNTPGVTGFVGMGNNPTPLRPEEVAQIVKRMEAEAPTVNVTYKVGERVRIVDGPFNDFRGMVAEIDMERTKVRVMVSFFGRETPVELDFLQVEKA